MLDWLACFAFNWFQRDLCLQLNIREGTQQTLIETKRLDTRPKYPKRSKEKYQRNLFRLSFKPDLANCGRLTTIDSAHWRLRFSTTRNVFFWSTGRAMHLRWTWTFKGAVGELRSETAGAMLLVKQREIQTRVLIFFLFCDHRFLRLAVCYFSFESQYIENTGQAAWLWGKWRRTTSGAPKENIVQNHLNIAL